MAELGTRRSTDALRERLGLSRSCALTGVSQLRIVAPRRSPEYFQPPVQVPPQLVEGREARLYLVGSAARGAFREMTPVRPPRQRHAADEADTTS